MATHESTDSDLGQTMVMPADKLLPADARKSKAPPPPVAGRASAPKPLQTPKQVALVEGSAPDFTAETNSILQDRLRQASLFLFFGYLSFLLKGVLLPDKPLQLPEWGCLGLLAIVTAIMGLIAQRLCMKCNHVLSHLRGVEATMWGSSAVLFLAVGYNVLLNAAEDGYLVNFTPAWLILIFTYALFIPNTWQRAARTIIPLAVGPLVPLLVAWLTSENVARLIQETNDFHHIFLETIMAMTFAAVTALGGVRIIRSLRTQAFEAQQLGQYRLKRLLGRGGMGEVYLAEHLMLKRPCAIKIIRPEKAGDPATLARFEQEVQATAKLTHWNTVEIYDFGRTEDGTFYYVMEYLPGMSLDQVVEMHGPLPAARVIQLMTQTCDALAEAHNHCLVHRDIKPANIFAAKRGGTYDVAKLLDFGLVRSLAQDASEHLTQESVVTGSPLYMSPEQARGDEVDGRSDIYALGCTMYFLLTGRTPFNEFKAIKLLLAHAQQAPEPPSTHLPTLPADLERVVMRCLEKSPADRFGSVEELRDALLECEDAQKWSRRTAQSWWQNHGCPKKAELDSCISRGVELHDEDLSAHATQLSQELVNA